MAFFGVYGSAGGVHSDVQQPGKYTLRCNRFHVEKDIPHGPVKVLMENGVMLENPKLIPVNIETHTKDGRSTSRNSLSQFFEE